MLGQHELWVDAKHNSKKNDSIWTWIARMEAAALFLLHTRLLEIGIDSAPFFTTHVLWSIYFGYLEKPKGLDKNHQIHGQQSLRYNIEFFRSRNAMIISIHF